jgi:hypothetical protein
MILTMIMAETCQFQKIGRFRFVRIKDAVPSKAIISFSNCWLSVNDTGSVKLWSKSSQLIVVTSAGGVFLKQKNSFLVIFVSLVERPNKEQVGWWIYKTKRRVVSMPLLS